jgi:hypothetical protein
MYYITLAYVTTEWSEAKRIELYIWWQLWATMTVLSPKRGSIYSTHRFFHLDGKFL